MRNDLFLSPVPVLAGSAGRRDIASLSDMHEFLTSWPQSRHCDIYRTALRACQAAQAGHLTTEQARRAFVEFAKMSRILDPRMDAFIANAALGKMSDRHA